MVRILHTGDWHIGASLRGHDREREHAVVLDQVVNIATEHDVDALVLAGDVFDAHNPSAASQALYYRTLANLSRVRPGMTVVVVAGNHDAASRLEAPHPLLSAFDVQVIGNVRRQDGVLDADRHLVPILVRGEVAAHVLAVSHPTTTCLPRLEQDGDGSPVARAVQSLYDALWSGTRHRHGGVPVIVTGHLHVAGGIESEGAERRILVGGEHAVGPDVFPSDAAYVALAHLHRAQHVGHEGVRYSGSLLPLSATEMAYSHGVTVVTLDGAGRTIQHVPIERPVGFLRVPVSGETTLGDLGDQLSALTLPTDLPHEARPFVQVHLSRDGLPHGFRQEVDRIGDRYPVRIVDVRVPTLSDASSAVSPIVTVRLADVDPETVFAAAFERKHNRPPTDEHRRLFALLREEG